MRAHALLSASGAHRWLNCTASARLEENMEDTSSSYAKEGTLAHALAEAILENDTLTIQKLKTDELFYTGMVDEVEDYTSYCLERFNEMLVRDPNAIMEIETRLNLTKYIPNGFGTGDCIIIGDGLLEIIDLKFGKGVEVSPENNPQFMLYALGALEEFGFLYDIDKVRMTVAQVRLQGIQSFDMKVKDLKEWGEKVVIPKAKEAYSGGSDPCPGSWCGFCKFKAKCKKRSEFLQSQIKKYKDYELSLDDISNILNISKDIQGWLSDIEANALDEALKGITIPGYKLVEGRSNRKIADEEGLINALLLEDYKEEQIYKPKAIETITNLEKLVGKKHFTEISKGFVVKPEGKPTLAPESDKRPAINTIENEFDFN